MKIRQSFVTNSSSSSFVTLYLGMNVLKEFRDGGSIDIDFLINKLQEAKEKGIKTLDVESYEEYDG